MKAAWIESNRRERLDDVEPGLRIYYKSFVT